MLFSFCSNNYISRNHFYQLNFGIQFLQNRMSCCKQCQQKETKYRIMQSDLQFQIKKMTQDLATEKVTLEMQYQRESKKIIERYNREKGERQQQNRKWMQKYDQIVNQYQQKIIQLHKEHELKEKEIESIATKNYIKKQQQIKNNYDNNMNKIQQTHKTTINNLEAKMQASCLEAKRQKEEEINKLNAKHHEQLGNVVTEYDERIKQLKQEISQGQESLDKLKLESHQKKTLLYEQLYQRKQEISNLKYNVDQLNATIKAHQQELRMKNLEIQVMKEQHEAQIKQLQTTFQKEKEDIITGFTQQIEQMLRDKLDDCEKFEQVVRDIEDKRQNQIRLYESNLKEVKEFVQERPSRQQDIQQINILKDLLNQKEKQFQKALNEAKGYRLELNNKQDIFNKIFCSHSPLNIQKIGKKKDSKLPRTSSSILKDNTKYQTVGTFHTLSTTTDLFKKERLVLQPKSTKFF